jgi:tetratricopeptide (TPR) repeat protein
MGRTIIGGVAFAVLACLSCAAAVAESADSSPGWDACLKTATRACVLDEALYQVLSFLGADRSPPPEPAALPALRAAPLETIAEAYANAGNIDAALRVAGLIPSDHPALVSTLRVIAGAEAKLGLENEAKQTFVTVDLLADSLEDPLGHAEALQAIAKAEAEAGMATEADRDFLKALALAAAFEISAGSPCIVFPSAESRLESLLRLLAEQQARAGDVSSSLNVARAIKYNANTRTEALVAIAAILSQVGHQSEAGPVLKEALEAAASSQTPPELWPSCRSVRHLAASGGLYIELLGKVAKAQARAGLIEDATLTLDAALQFVPTIKDSSIQTADLAKSLALSEIAMAQNETGLTSQSATTLERAAQAASQVNDHKFPLLALIKLGRAQGKTGHITDAAATFDKTEALARALPDATQRGLNLLDIFNARVEAGLAGETDDTLARSLEAARSIPAKSKPILLLRRIALAQEKQGRLQDAVATYQEVLEAVAANDAQGVRANGLFFAIRRMPGLVGDSRNLIAQTAPQALQIAQSIADGLRRAEALVIIAEALPN